MLALFLVVWGIRFPLKYSSGALDSMMKGLKFPYDYSTLLYSTFLFILLSVLRTNQAISLHYDAFSGNVNL